MTEYLPYLIFAAVLAAGVLALMRVSTPKSRNPSLGPAKTIEEPSREVSTPLAHFPGDGEFETDVVGESHYQEALEAICGGRCEGGHELPAVAYLIPEPFNAHDRNAVRVEIQGRKVGYLPREVAAVWTRNLRAHGHENGVLTCDALIVGGWSETRRDGSANVGSFGVVLDIVDDDDLEDSAGRG